MITTPRTNTSPHLSQVRDSRPKMSESITSALHSQLSKLSEKDPVVASLQHYSTYKFFCGKRENVHLQYVSSCDVADALLKLGVTHGGFLGNM